VADNFTQCAFKLDVTAEGAAWLAQAFEEVKRASCDDIEDGDTIVAELFSSPDDLWTWGWEYQHNNSFFIYSEVCGNVEALAVLLQEYLRRFDPECCIEIEWANTCSTMRAGEFGGGACVVRATGTKWHLVAQWLLEQREKSS